MQQKIFKQKEIASIQSSCMLRKWEKTREHRLSLSCAQQSADGIGWLWLALLLSKFNPCLFLRGHNGYAFLNISQNKTQPFYTAVMLFSIHYFLKHIIAILSTYLSTMFSSHKCAFKMLFPVVTTLLPNADMVHGRFQCSDQRCFMMMWHRCQIF